LLAIFSSLQFVSNDSFQTELEEAGYSVGLLLKIPKAMMNLSTSSHLSYPHHHLKRILGFFEDKDFLAE